MRVVLDTNVVVSGLLQSKGNPAPEKRRGCVVLSPAEFMDVWRKPQSK